MKRPLIGRLLNTIGPRGTPHIQTSSPRPKTSLFWFQENRLRHDCLLISHIEAEMRRWWHISHQIRAQCTTPHRCRLRDRPKHPSTSHLILPALRSVSPPDDRMEAPDLRIPRMMSLRHSSTATRSQSISRDHDKLENTGPFFVSYVMTVCCLWALGDYKDRP